MTDYEREDYEDARRRIEAVIAERRTWLNLTGLGSLTALPPELVVLTQLTKLDLDAPEITDATPLAVLTRLTDLRLSGTGITDAAPLAVLRRLTDLRLSGTGITDAAPLAALTHLSNLDLSGTGITDAAPLAALTHLSNLDLSGTGITDAAPLAALTHLSNLDLTNTGITDATPLAVLTRLTDLRLGRTGITDAAPLAALTHLSNLDLSNTGITDTASLVALTQLTKLDLKRCTSLTRLALPEGMLARLNDLFLEDCNLADVPRELCRKGWGRNVAREVHAHFRALREQGPSRLRECKIVLLGNGRAGKTSSRRVLMGEPFDAHETSTHAIRLHRWKHAVRLPEHRGKMARVRLNVWDFGGQDIYHQAHRLFLGTRAVFLVCWNPWEDTAQLRALGDEPRGLAHWLAQVCSASNDAQILILRTHADRDADELRRRGLRAVPDWRAGVPERFHGLPCLPLGAAASDRGDCAAILRWLDAAVAAEICAGAAERPAGWMAIRRTLEPLEAENATAFAKGALPPCAVLSERKFANIVKMHLPATKWKRDLPFVRGFLHDIGALYYDSRLGGRVVLDQRWAIEGIYAILERGPRLDWLRERGGLVAARTLSEVWRAAGYTAEEEEVLLDFMLSCGQAALLVEWYENTSGEAIYLVPALLPTAEELAVQPAPEPKGERTRFGGWAGPTLGADVAQALIVAAAKEFRRGGRYWRWGAEITSQRLGATARVEWKRSEAWGYGGELDITLWGSPAAAAKLGGAIYEQLRRHLPNGIPETIAPTHARAAASPEWTNDDRPLQAVADSPEVAHGRRLTFSLAGSNAANPHLEGAPEALYEALAENAKGSGWSVFSYKHTTDQPDLNGLLTYVGTGDYVVIFLSQKYLGSRYCMEELRLVYEAKPRGKFSPENTRIFGLGDWRPLTDEGWQKLRNEWKRGLKKWRAGFVKTVADFVEDEAAVSNVRKTEPAIGWFGLCGKDPSLAVFISTLRSYVAESAPLPFTEGDGSCEKWLAKWTSEIGGRLGL